jgi:hypothetical protein
MANPMWTKVGTVVGLSVAALLAHGQTSTWFGGTQGEGYSSSTQDAPVEFAFRMFTAPMFSGAHSICDELPAKVARFESYREELRLHVGERLSLSKVVLRARDRIGGFVPRVPFAADVYYELGVLDYDDTSPAGPELVGAKPGKGKVIFQALCTGAERDPVRLEIPVVIVP